MVLTQTRASSALPKLHLADDFLSRRRASELRFGWLNRQVLLGQTEWWVPVDGWGDWCDGHVLSSLDPEHKEVVALVDMTDSWRENLVAMLFRLTPEMLAGWWMCTALRAPGRTDATLGEIAELIDNPARHAGWLRSQPLVARLLELGAGNAGGHLDAAEEGSPWPS